MIKFFRKIRLNLLTENKFSKYLLYAIGEIILVVIGILIALSINTSREEFLQKKSTQGIFEQIEKDLTNDSLQLAVSINSLTFSNKMIMDIIEDKIHDSIFNKVDTIEYSSTYIRKMRGLVTSFEKYSPNNKGFNLLKSSNQNSLVDDQLVNDIIEFYSTMMTKLPEYYQAVVEVAKRNILQYQQYEWYENWALQKYDSRFIEYMRTSPESRKRMSEYYIYSSVQETYYKALEENREQLKSKITKRINSIRN